MYYLHTQTHKSGGEMPKCFNKKDWPLMQVRLQEYRGFLFITGTDATPPLDATLGNLGLAIGEWPFEDFGNGHASQTDVLDTVTFVALRAATVGRREYLVECNWKFIMQNTSETYHTSYGAHLCITFLWWMGLDLWLGSVEVTLSGSGLVDRACRSSQGFARPNAV
jgi:phenylpropionate dioxygenase-like ring-hydroxylating dioxygenase large terminal subunit